MKVFYFIAAGLLTISIVSCKGNEENSSNATSITLNPSAVYYLTSDYANNTSYLYELDVDSAKPTLVWSTWGTSDVWGVRTENAASELSGLYLVERYADNTQASRLTYYGQSVANQVSQSLPINLSDMIVEEDEADSDLVVSGFAKKDIAIVDEFAQGLDSPATTVAGLSPTSLIDGDNFQALLRSGKQFYALTIGLKWDNIKASQAKIYQLSGEHYTDTPSRSWNVAAGGITCHDVNAVVHLFGSNSVAIACNPSYALPTSDIDNSWQPAVFLLQPSSTGVSVSLLASSSLSSATKQYLLGGTRAASASALPDVLVSEVDAEFPSTYQDSYWLNTSSKEKVILTGLAGPVTYQASQKRYIFGCVMGDLSTKQCAPETLGVSYDGVTSSFVIQGLPIVDGNIQFLPLLP